MYCDLIDGLVGKNVTVFLSTAKDTALNGVLLDVGQDYIVVSGRFEGDKNHIPLHAVVNIAAVTE